MFRDAEHDPVWQFSSVPIEEQLDALGRAVDAGKVSDIWCVLPLHTLPHQNLVKQLFWLADQIDWTQKWNTIWCHEVPSFAENKACYHKILCAFVVKSNVSSVSLVALYMLGMISNLYCLW